AQRPEYPATAEEQTARERIARIEKRLGHSDDPQSLALRQRAARLRGALTWRLETEYNDRLTAAYVHLNELKAPLDALSQRYDAFVRTRQAATHSYVGYDARPSKPVGTPGTLAELRNVRPDLQEVKVEQGLDQAMQQYRRFLEEAPETAMTPEAMRRLADLQLEKQFGIRTGNAKPREMAAPKPAPILAGSRTGSPNPVAAAASVSLRESDQDFERRTTAEAGILVGSNAGASPTDTVRA